MDWRNVCLRKHCEVSLMNISTHRLLGHGVKQLLREQQSLERLRGREEEDEDEVVKEMSSDEEKDGSIQDILEDNKRKLKHEVERSRKRRKYYTETIGDSETDSDMSIVIEEAADPRDTSASPWVNRSSKLGVKTASGRSSSATRSRSESSSRTLTPLDTSEINQSDGQPSLNLLSDHSYSQRRPSESSHISLKLKESSLTYQRSREHSSSSQKSREPSVYYQRPNEHSYSSQKSQEPSISYQNPSEHSYSSKKPHEPSVSYQNPSEHLYSSQKSREPSFVLGIAEDPVEERMMRNFERETNIRFKQLGVILKEEHLFIRRLKQVRLSLAKSRDKIRRLFSSQQKEYDERIILPSIYRSAEFPCLFGCGLGFSRHETRELAAHMDFCSLRNNTDQEDEFPYEPEVVIEGEESPEVEIEEETVCLPCPKCSEPVEESQIPRHLYFHLPYPCVMCIHRYEYKMDIEDHIINDHATHFMSSIPPLWRRILPNTDIQKPVAPAAKPAQLPTVLPLRNPASLPRIANPVDFGRLSQQQRTSIPLAMRLPSAPLPRNMIQTLSPQPMQGNLASIVPKEAGPAAVTPTSPQGRFFVKDSEGNLRPVIFLPAGSVVPGLTVPAIQPTAADQAPATSTTQVQPSTNKPALPGLVNAGPNVIKIMKSVFASGLGYRDKDGAPANIDKDGAPARVDKDGAPVVVEPTVLDPIVHDVF